MKMAEKTVPGSKIRVLDLTMFWAGPTCSALLADFGMEVIKIEPCHHPDPDRIVPAGLAYLNNEPGEDPWNRAMLHLRRQRNKLSATLDLTTSEGRDIFLKLLKISDVVVENFRTGVLERFRLGYSELQQVNPSIILMSISSQGDTGPERKYGSNAEVLAFTSGARSFTGYPDEISGFTVAPMADPMGGTTAAGFVMAALRYRRQTGKGVHVVLSQRELLSCFIGEEMMDYLMNKRVAKPRGNAHPFLAPHGCYPCKGEDAWITLAVGDDQEWQSLCQLMGQPELATDPRYAGGLGRWHNQHEIDEVISQWTAQYNNKDLMQLLQQRGVTAGAVFSARDSVEDEHLKIHGFWETVNDPRPGFGNYISKGRGFYLSKTPIGTRSRAPMMGEHNNYVFGELAGMSKEQIEELERKGIIGTAPTPEVQATIPAIRARKQAKEQP